MDKILDRIDKPSDLKALELEELVKLSAEVRELIIETVSHTGGHLAANLGVVELTIALLYVFDAEDNRILWDVSHQCYAYKILTGRKDSFCSLRQHEGISGFIKRGESPYDYFGAGHSGTALSAALGMAAARDRKGGNEGVVAVIGDASMGCGISLEALNNITGATERLVVILNDNEMSIASNVGSISKYLGSLLTNPRYNRWKRSVEGVASRLKMEWFRKVYYKIEEVIKSLFLRSVIFEEFGLRYVGPINGHNIPSLVDAFTIARDYDRPIILHVNTCKGKGYQYAEDSPEKWHGTSPFDIGSGDLKQQSGKPTYSNVFGVALERIAEKDDKIVAITAAMQKGTGLTPFSERYPDRFFDVGISEEHAVVFAAGLAAEGFKPVFAVYSTFLQRAVDCVIHDVCLQNLPVVFCLDRSGVVGDDGPTHHGVFDIALLRCVPNLTIMQPANEAELADMLNTAVALNKPVVVRYPRGSGPGVHIDDELQIIPEGRALTVRPGKEVWLWALGDMVPLAEKTAALLDEEGISAGVINARFVKPFDEDLLSTHARESRVIATLENGMIAGGFGAGVESFVGERGLGARVVKFGWPDEFVPQGSNDILLRKYGLEPATIAASVKKAYYAKDQA